MHRTIRTAVLASGVAALAAVAAPAHAQPTGMPVRPPDPQPAVDEARVREIATQIAQAMLEDERARAADEAAKKAANDAAAAKAKAEAGQKTGDDANLHGDNGFMDTRLNFTLTNENLLVKPGEGPFPFTMGWRFGRPSSLGTLFFDNYDTRFSGYETLSTAIMYRDYEKDHLQVEGAFVLRFNEITERRIDFSDAGSYVRVSWWKDPTHTDPTRLSLTVFPTSADRFRLGYSYRLSWGGSEEFRRSSQAVPGFKVQYDTDKAYAFVGAKTAVVLDPAIAEQVAAQSVLAGAGYDVTPEVRVEVNGGYLDRGNNELQDVNTEAVQLFGASAQVAVHHGMPVQSSIDYKLYKYDPERTGLLFQKQKYPGGLSWLAMSEVTLLGQTLKDPENSGSTKIQWGAAGDVNLRVLKDRIRLRVDAQYRDLAFVLHSVPSLPTYSDFPAAYDITPNIFADVGVDKNWDDRLTLGVAAGVEMPATLTTPAGVPGDTTATGKSTVVVRNYGGDTLYNVLPKGESAVPMVAGKFTGQLDFGDIYSSILEVYYVRDANRTQLTRVGPEDPFTYDWANPNQLGVNMTLQAKF